jgi:hypothetical protein
MVNFNNLDGTVKVRQGNDRWSAVAGAAQYVTDYITSLGTELFLVMRRPVTGYKFYDVTTTGGGTLDHTELGTASVTPNAFFFNDNIIFCIGTDGALLYDGSTWALAYTFPSIAPSGGTQFKARAYFADYNSAKFGYGGIDAITGSVTEVDLTSQITSTAVIYMIRPISMTQNLTSESVLSFIFSSGEILVYSGSYPDATNWSRIARFKISKPISLASYIEAKGDTIIFTESEILSLRNLFVSGYDKERDEGIGSAINKRWRQCIAAFSGTLLYLNITGAYDEKYDRIIIAFPKYVNPETGLAVDNTLFLLIYDFNLEAWYEYVQTDTRISSVKSITFFNGSIYIAIISTTSDEGLVVKLEAGSGFVDDQLDGTGTNPIDYDLITAPLPISKFGANAITGVEAIVKSDLYPQTSYKFIADLGRQETTAQTLPDQGTSIAKPMMNVGIQGAIAAQLEIYGSTVSASIGLEISALNVWYNSGDSGSR